jgi:hypothetical protein
LAQHEALGGLVHQRQRAFDVFAVAIDGLVDGGAGKGDGLDHEGGLEALRSAAEQQQAGEVRHAVAGEVEISSRRGSVASSRAEGVASLQVVAQQQRIEIVESAPRWSARPRPGLDLHPETSAASPRGR